MADQPKPPSESFRGLAYGLLFGWAFGMLWFVSLVVAFGLEPSVLTVTVDSTGRHETLVTVLERLALVPVWAIPWAIVVGVVGAVVGWNGGRFVTGGRSTAGRRVVTGLAYGLLVGWIVGVVEWASLTIAFGPSGSTYERGGVIRVDTFHPILETIALERWTATPWAVVGAVTGAIIGWLGGRLEAILTFAGMAAGVCFVLSTSPFDGWLALTIPVSAFMGTGIGLAGGLLVRLAIS